MKRRKWEEFTLKKENCKKIKDKQAKTKVMFSLKVVKKDNLDLNIPVS